MMDPRRSIMHAAVASGGVSAILMSTAVNDSGAHARKAAEDCLDPLLRATVHAIDAAKGTPGDEQRAALEDVIEDYLDLPKIGDAGRCRICGCVEQMACSSSETDHGWDGPCGWADSSHTLCNNPDCLAAAAGAQAAVAA